MPASPSSLDACASQPRASGEGKAHPPRDDAPGTLPYADVRVCCAWGPDIAAHGWGTGSRQVSGSGCVPPARCPASTRAAGSTWRARKVEANGCREPLPSNRKGTSPRIAKEPVIADCVGINRWSRGLSGGAHPIHSEMITSTFSGRLTVSMVPWMTSTTPASCAHPARSQQLAW